MNVFKKKYNVLMSITYVQGAVILLEKYIHSDGRSDTLITMYGYSKDQMHNTCNITDGMIAIMKDRECDTWSNTFIRFNTWALHEFVDTTHKGKSTMNYYRFRTYFARVPLGISCSYASQARIINTENNKGVSFFLLSDLIKNGLMTTSEDLTIKDFIDVTATISKDTVQILRTALDNGIIEKTMEKERKVLLRHDSRGLPFIVLESDSFYGT